jgi:hypothetical protein
MSRGPGKKRLRYLVPIAAVAGGIALAVATDPGGQGAPAPTRSVSGDRPTAVGAHFAYLTAQHTNRCDLQAQEIMGYAPTQRMQGSCCQTMDERAYRQQLHKLARYRGVSEIPRDPYDISALLAQRLLRYDRTIRLDAAQRATYRRAMRISDQKGPCCCRCWRWQAFAGMAKHLIVARRWSAPQVARAIDAVEGCGGRPANAAST